MHQVNTISWRKKFKGIKFHENLQSVVLHFNVWKWTKNEYYRYYNIVSKEKCTAKKYERSQWQCSIQIFLLIKGAKK